MTRGMALDPQDCAEDRLERQFAVKGGHAGACPPVMAKTGPFVAEMRNLGLKMRPEPAKSGHRRSVACTHKARGARCGLRLSMAIMHT